MTAKELFLEAMRRTDAGDLDGFIALQGPDGTWVTPNAELQGHAALREWLGVWMAQRLTGAERATLLDAAALVLRLAT